MKNTIVKFLETMLFFLVFVNTSESNSIFKIKNDYDITQVFDEVMIHSKNFCEEILLLVSNSTELSQDQKKEMFSTIELKNPCFVSVVRKSPKYFLKDLEDTVNYVKSNEEKIRRYLTKYKKYEEIEDIYNFFLKQIIYIEHIVSLILFHDKEIILSIPLKIDTSFSFNEYPSMNKYIGMNLLELEELIIEGDYRALAYRARAEENKERKIRDHKIASKHNIISSIYDLIKELSTDELMLENKAEKTIYLQRLKDLAERNNPEAKYFFGLLYSDETPDFSTTDFPIEKNLKQYATCIRSSAENGYPDAMLALSDVYRTGHGIEKSMIKSQFWLSKFLKTQ